MIYTINNKVIFLIFVFMSSSLWAASPDRESKMIEELNKELSKIHTLKPIDLQAFELLDKIVDDKNNYRFIIKNKGPLVKVSFIQVSKKFETMREVLKRSKQEKYYINLSSLCSLEAQKYLTIWEDYCQNLKFTDEEIAIISKTVGQIKDLNGTLQSKSLSITINEMPPVRKN